MIQRSFASQARQCEYATRAPMVRGLALCGRRIDTGAVWPVASSCDKGSPSVLRRDVCRCTSSCRMRTSVRNSLTCVARVERFNRSYSATSPALSCTIAYLVETVPDAYLSFSAAGLLQHIELV